MRILITGAGGFIGASLVRRLISENFKVHVITRKTSNLWRIEDILGNITNHHLDLVNQKETARFIECIKPQIIFHLASLGLKKGVSAPPEKLIKVNLLGTVNLLEACSNFPLQLFVNTGSSAEYGPKDHPMKENDSCEPSTFYGVSKLASTLYGLVAAEKFKKPIVSLRIFSPFGPFDDISRLITYVIIRCLKNQKLLLANPNSVRDFIFIDDVVDAYLATINKAKKYKKGEIFNIGSGVQRSVAEIVSQVVKITGSKSKIYWGVGNSRPQESPMWQADITLAKSKLKWVPKYSLEEGLQKTITWFSQNLNHYRLK